MTSSTEIIMNIEKKVLQNWLTQLGNSHLVCQQNFLKTNISYSRISTSKLRISGKEILVFSSVNVEVSKTKRIDMTSKIPVVFYLLKVSSKKCTERQLLWDFIPKQSPWAILQKMCFTFLLKMLQNTREDIYFIF